MALTDINSEDRLVQQTFADHLRDKPCWDCVCAYSTETFGGAPDARACKRERGVLVRDLLLPRLINGEIVV